MLMHAGSWSLDPLEIKVAADRDHLFWMRLVRSENLHFIVLCRDFILYNPVKGPIKAAFRFTTLAKDCRHVLVRTQGAHGSERCTLAQSIFSISSRPAQQILTGSSRQGKCTVSTSLTSCKQGAWLLNEQALLLHCHWIGVIFDFPSSRLLLTEKKKTEDCNFYFVLFWKAFGVRRKTPYLCRRRRIMRKLCAQENSVSYSKCLPCGSTHRANKHFKKALKHQHFAEICCD